MVCLQYKIRIAFINTNASSARRHTLLWYVKIHFYNAPSDPRYDTDDLQFTDALSVTYSIASQVLLTFSTQHTFRFPSTLYLILFCLVLETYAWQHDVN